MTSITITHFGKAVGFVVVTSDPAVPVHKLRVPVTTFGSDPACDVVLVGPDVASQHFQIRCERDMFYLDAAPMPVVVNGKRVERLDLVDNDVLEIGRVKLIYKEVTV